MKIVFFGFLVHLALSTLVLEAQPARIDPLFTPEALTGWEHLDAEETLPYQAERIEARWVFGARSPRGSYVFVTRLDNTLARPAFRASALLGFFEENSYADLAPEGFRSELVRIRDSPRDGPVDDPGARQAALGAISNSFATSHLGYQVGQGDEPAWVQGIFLPLVIWDQQHDTYHNWIYVAAFRGAWEAAADREAFQEFWGSISLPSGWVRLDTEGFNAIRQTLLAGHRQGEPPKAHTSTSAAPFLEPTHGSKAAALVAAMVRTLSERASNRDEQLLRRSRAAYPDTVVSGALGRLLEDRDPVWQQEVWHRVLALADVRVRQRLATLFLAESITRGKPDLTEALFRDALAKVGDLPVLACEEVYELIDALASTPAAACWEGASYRGFFHLGARGHCADLGSLFRQAGFSIPPIEAVATRLSNGLWSVQSDAPQVLIVSQQGSFYRMEQEARQRAGENNRYWRRRRISNLLEVIESSTLSACGGE